MWWLLFLGTREHTWQKRDGTSGSAGLSAALRERTRLRTRLAGGAGGVPPAPPAAPAPAAVAVDVDDGGTGDGGAAAAAPASAPVDAAGAPTGDRHRGATGPRAARARAPPGERLVDADANSPLRLRLTDRRRGGGGGRVGAAATLGAAADGGGGGGSGAARPTGMDKLSGEETARRAARERLAGTPYAGAQSATATDGARKRVAPASIAPGGGSSNDAA